MCIGSGTFNHNRARIASDVCLAVSHKIVLANNFVKKKNKFRLFKYRSSVKIQMQAELFWRRQED
jgi:hypothetical protein